MDGDATTGGIEEIVDVVQGLLVCDVVAQPFYGVELPPAQAAAIHERDSATLLDLVTTVDGRPIVQARPPARGWGLDAMRSVG